VTAGDASEWIDHYVDTIAADAQLKARGQHFTCSFRLDMEAHAFVIDMYRGQVARVVIDPSALGEHYSFTLAADAATWVEMAEPVPAPRYQGIFAAQAQAGLRIEGDLLVLMQHLRCFVRQHELLRVCGVPAAVRAAALPGVGSSEPVLT